jgi:hypothetical protein
MLQCRVLSERRQEVAVRLPPGPILHVHPEVDRAPKYRSGSYHGNKAHRESHLVTLSISRDAAVVRPASKSTQ